MPFSVERAPQSRCLSECVFSARDRLPELRPFRSRRPMLSLLPIAVFGALLVLRPHALQGQTAGSVLVVVQVRDSSGRPVGAADLSLFKNDSEPVAFGRSSDQGRFAFSVPSSQAALTLAVRHIGYAEAKTRVVANVTDTVQVTVRLALVASGLDTVRVFAGQLPLARQPFLGADEIVRDTRAIFTLSDVLRKLRPDIGYQSHRCPTTPVRWKGPTVAPPRIYVNGVWVPDQFGPMSRIHAEHIASLMYVNCLDHSIPGLSAKPWPAVYVALKPGVGWDLKDGTHVVDSAAFAAAESRVPPK